ncbi:MAG TPA: hypothetical protein VG900_02690 [Hyphomicrobiaceae bacterium]|jgi:hypothetical protein|nr:hypothetical protein [Hyphomicrobiaceae bacterium]
MSLRALPWTIIPVILYNVVALWGGSAPDGVLHSNLFSVRMLQGAVWNFTWGDLIVFLTMLVLFVELIKATYTSTVSLVDHGLSMVVFIICIVEFLVVNGAATSTFFLVMVGALIDVVAGFTIGIRVARRDLSIGADV